MEVRSSRRVRTLVTQMARSGLSANEIAPALISMMARSETLQSKAGYIDARPLPPYRRNSLAMHGRTIHSGQNAEILITSLCFPLYPQEQTSTADMPEVRFVPKAD